MLKEKRRLSARKKSKKIEIAGKSFSNYLSMSGVKLSAREFVAMWSLLTIVPMLTILLLHGNVVTVAAVGIICFCAPPLLIKRSRKKRMEEFDKQLGESLIVMGNCIKSGFSFQQAMESIAKEMQPPISVEFLKALREIHYGISMKEALGHMVDRVKSKDLDLLVSAVLTSAQVGGSLSSILDTISETVKDRIRIKDEIRVLTSSGRASGLIIGLLPVFVILILMLVNPAYFGSFFESDIGKVMMIVSVILELTGFTIINKIINIKY